jgi:hypothetical protein
MELIEPTCLADKKVLLSGNRCGHDPKSPRCAIFPERHKKRPDILEQAKARLHERYFKPDTFFKDLKNPSCRQKRSERREAIMSVSEVLVQHCDLETLRVGWYAGKLLNKFNPLSLIKIAKLAGMQVWRAKRAMRDMVKAGYLFLKRRFKKTEQGDYYGEFSIRTLSIKFFKHLGFSYSTLELKRHWRRKKTAIEQARNNPVLKELSDLCDTNAKQPRRRKDDESNVEAQKIAERAEQERQALEFDLIGAELARIKHLHPGTSHLALCDLARKNLIARGELDPDREENPP